MHITETISLYLKLYIDIQLLGIFYRGNKPVLAQPKIINTQLVHDLTLHKTVDYLTI